MGRTYLQAAAFALVMWCLGRDGTVSVAGIVSDTDAVYHKAVELALKIAHAEIKQQKTIDEYLFRKGVDEKKGNRNGFSHKQMLGMFRVLKQSSLSDTERASVFIRATQELTRILGKSVDHLWLHAKLNAIWHSKTSAYCTPRQPSCAKSKYRTLDGSCNNLHHPTWGMAHRDQKRYLSPVYEDDLNEPRMSSVTGGILPSARVISNVVHGSGVCDLLEPKDSAMVMQWGQLLDHDFAHTPTLKGFNGATVTCCNIERKILQERSACFPIAIPPNDKHFSRSCMNFVRSAPTTNDHCGFGVRNQLNQASSYIDASFLYGPDERNYEQSQTSQNGKHSRGLLKMNDFGFFKPDENQDKCQHQKAGDYCMKSGDPRIHTVPGLASLQIIFLREHNRIATILGKINPHWNDEIIFQETRKIIMAINQHVSFKEYLPIILGPDVMQDYDLNPSPKGHNTVYDPAVDATMANAFGAAAFRFGHSQVSADVVLIDGHNHRTSLKIEETFNRPAALLSDSGKGCDHVNRWLFLGKSARSDRFLEPGVRNKLFLDKNGNSFDLASLNIQRGRDHGIPGYIAYRKWCGLPVAFHFTTELGGLVDHDEESAVLLNKVYSHPDDIDLYAGGLSERHIRGAAMGPLFACIVARQFREMKIGDRFWYENQFHETGFTQGQLHQIKKIRLSKILCNNMDVLKMTKNAFQIPSKRNPFVSCQNLPDIDLKFWKDFHPEKAFSHHYPPVSPIQHLLVWS